MEREVVIVGAGPAGSTAAMILAQKGHDVLLLDRQTFPRDKICGDGVPSRALELLRKYGAGERVRDALQDGRFYPIHHMHLVSPRGAELSADFSFSADEFPSAICPRMEFDNLIFQHAVAVGAEFQQAHVSEPLLEGNRVVGVQARIGKENVEIRAKAVIAADGVTSTLARKLRPEEDKPQKAHRAIALRAYIEGLTLLPETIEFYLYKGILPGYAWIFPLGGERANIGLGIRIDKFEKQEEKLEQMLDRFLAMPRIAERLKKGYTVRNMATWQLNFGSQKIQRAFDGALLIGDAGGYINPLTGGGIENGMISAEIAAEVLHEALAQNRLSRAELTVYEQRCDDEMRDSMLYSYRLQNWLLRYPLLTDFVVRFMGRSNHFTKTILEKL